MTRWLRVLSVVLLVTSLGLGCNWNPCKQWPGLPGCKPTPSPSPSPTAEPTPTPTPEPTPEPTPTPTPTPSPTPGSVCPKPLAAGAVLYLNNKAYGNGFDSSLRVKGDPEFCRLIHGVPENDCHLEGWPTRVECEVQLMGGCPTWQYSAPTAGAAVQQCSDDHYALASCDHFGNPVYRDDPQTPTTGDSIATLQGFEGEPKVCGLQRDSHGPIAGFFTIPHGAAYIRACAPNPAVACGPWRKFDH